jgi:hypothetical protein
MGDIAIRDQLLLRMERQSILTRSDPVDFTAVLSEAALRKMVGGTGIMRRQLDKLGEIAQLPNVTLHVLPFDAPPHPIANSPFVLLGFPEEDESIVYLEDADGATYLTKPPEIIGRYTLVFSRLRAAALNPDDSLAFIAKIAEDYR